MTAKASTILPIAQCIDATQKIDKKQQKRKEKRKLSLGSSEDQQKTKTKKTKESVEGKHFDLMSIFTIKIHIHNVIQLL